VDELTGKVAVVTGAASGIGLALARAFAAEDMRVVLADVEEESLDTAVGSFSGSGAEVLGIPTDVSLFESVEALAAQTTSTLAPRTWCATTRASQLRATLGKVHSRSGNGCSP